MIRHIYRPKTGQNYCGQGTIVEKDIHYYEATCKFCREENKLNVVLAIEIDNIRAGRSILETVYMFVESDG